MSLSPDIAGGSHSQCAARRIATVFRYYSRLFQPHVPDREPDAPDTAHRAVDRGISQARRLPDA